MLRLLALVCLCGLSLSGCSLFSGESEVVVDVRLSPEAETLAVEVTVGGNPAATTASGAGGYQTGTLAVSASSTVVSCSVSSGSAATMGVVTLELEDGWRYPVTCAVQERDPSELCFGCRGSEAFALDPGLGVPTGQVLWVVWAGDPIDNPPVY